MASPTPIYYWHFDDTSGTTATDSVSGAKMALDRAAFVAGNQGNALRFNSQDGARLVTTTLPDLPAPWTVAVWVKREADTAGATLFSSDKYALKLEQWNNTHKLGFTAFGKFDTSFDYTAPIGQWVQVTLVGTATETRLYVSGKLQDTRQQSIALGLQWLGSSGQYVEIASMLLDEVQIFDEELTDAQVAELVAPCIVNGSFEEGPAPGQSSPIASGQTSIVGWTIGGAGIDYVETYWQPSDTRRRSIDLNGVSAGSIEQPIKTIAGVTYKVTFALAGNPVRAPNLKTMAVTANGASAATYSFDVQGKSSSNMGWVDQDYTFTATAASTVLKFTSTTDGACGPAIDNVRIARA